MPEFSIIFFISCHDEDCIGDVTVFDDTILIIAANDASYTLVPGNDSIGEGDILNSAIV